MTTTECPLRLGQTVRVKLIDALDWCSDWRGTYVVVGLIHEYWRHEGEVNVWLASTDEIEHGLGATDGFRAADLEVVT